MIKILVNALIGIILIVAWSRFVNLDQILSTLKKVNLVYLLPVLGFLFFSSILRAVRFKVFLAEIKKISLQDLIFLNGAAQMLNFFIPIRAGEIAKGVYLNTQYSLNLGKSIIWVFIDRFVDFLVLLLLAAALLLVVPTALSITIIKIITIILITVLLAAYLAVFQLSSARKIIVFLRPLLIFNLIKIYFDKVTSFILDSFSILDRHPKDLALMVIITVLAYFTDAAVWYFTFLSLGVSQSFIKMYLGQMLSALTYLIPAAPGYVGSAEASGLLILSGVFNIEANLASAMIVLFHIVSAVFILMFGLISIFSLKINLGEILKRALNRS
ncbi:flippase-like domain-containing protein [Candidatus Daviesbacteria bacterium]|nr:flippase-like domain-containing protein [Candidatus Daviesbacteria bacterium]